MPRSRQDIEIDLDIQRMREERERDDMVRLLREIESAKARPLDGVWSTRRSVEIDQTTLDEISEVLGQWERR